MKGNKNIWGALSLIQRTGMIVTGAGVTGIITAACLLRAFGVNFLGFEEILAILTFWLYMLGCSYGAMEDSHIKAGIFEAFLKPGRTKKVFIAFRDAITAVLSSVMFVWALVFFLESCGAWGVNPPVTTVFRIPMAIGYLSIAVGLGLSTLYFACHALNSIGLIATGREIVMFRDANEAMGSPDIPEASGLSVILESSDIPETSEIPEISETLEIPETSKLPEPPKPPGIPICKGE